MAQPFDASQQAYRYAIGIDLGTTNTVVAYVDLGPSGQRKRPEVAFFDIPQLVAPAEVSAHSALPSFLYLPGDYDLPPGSTALPWDEARDYAVGVLAREQGVRVPGRLVASAKSWLCHDRVDRSAALLPWGAPAEVPKVSPQEAATRYLQHVREAWDTRMAQGDPAQAFARQLLILTVPASFDEVARELTVVAAHAAGLPQVILLEEPLAAFYAWVDAHEKAWQAQLKPGQLILVCDVGGGTSDFTVVGVGEGDDGLRLDRLAVGDHLMLGGDNMDYALGRHVEAQFQGARLDRQRWHQLVHACRQGKEALLRHEDPEASVEVAVVGAGSSLIGGTLKGPLSRPDVEALLLEGFFPRVGMEEPLLQRTRTGLTELGLPYVHDPAITRHLAHFWRQAVPYLRETTSREHVYPDHILFNGGVLTPAPVQARIVELLQGWFAPMAGADWMPEVLHNPDLGRAVSQGAAYYGLVRLGKGQRVGSGSARAYYVGLADDGEGEQRQAVCLVPRGAEEGFAAHLDDLPIEALTNQPVTFHLYTSTTRSGDRLGDVVALDPDDVSALPPIRTVLQFGRKGVARALPIQVAVRLTEVGTLELWCQSRQTDHRWQLAFDVRQPLNADDAPDDADDSEAETALDLARLDDAEALLRRIFEEAGTPDGYWDRLEAILGMPPAEWPLPLLRKLADTLLTVYATPTADHEHAWFDLLGFCLRPGYGDPVDGWRVKQAWKRYLSGLAYPKALDNRLAWWRFWRRVSGGLTADRQAHIYHEARAFIQLKVTTKKPHRLYPRRMDPQEKEAAWQALASFERLSGDIKVALGRLLVQHIKTGRPRHGTWWALARAGARTPAYGPLDAQVPQAEVVAWLQTLLTLHLPRRDYVAYALVHLARDTHHPFLDVPDDARQLVHRWLRKMPDSDAYRDALTAPSPDADAWLHDDPPPPEAQALQDPHGITIAT